MAPAVMTLTILKAVDFFEVSKCSCIANHTGLLADGAKLFYSPQWSPFPYMKENWYFNHHYTFLTLFPTLLVLYLSLSSDQQYNKLHEVERVEAEIDVGWVVWVGNTVVEKDKKYKSQ
jgi:hypothetical protein